MVERDTVEQWVLEHACKYQILAVFKAVLERYPGRAFQVGVPDVYLGLMTVHLATTKDDARVLEAAQAAVEAIYHGLPGLAEHTSLVAEVIINMRIKALFWHLRSGRAVALAKLNQFFPRLGLPVLEERCPRVSQIVRQFRRFFLPLIAHSDLREAYLEGDYHREYGAKFEQRLQRHSQRFLRAVQKLLPPSPIDRILSGEVAVFRSDCSSQEEVNREMVLHCLADCDDPTDTRTSQALLDLLTMVSPLHPLQRLPSHPHPPLLHTCGSQDSGNTLTSLPVMADSGRKNPNSPSRLQLLVEAPSSVFPGATADTGSSAERPKTHALRSSPPRNLPDSGDSLECVPETPRVDSQIPGTAETRQKGDETHGTSRNGGRMHSAGAARAGCRGRSEILQTDPEIPNKIRRMRTTSDCTATFTSNQLLQRYELILRESGVCTRGIAHGGNGAKAASKNANKARSRCTVGGASTSTASFAAGRQQGNDWNSREKGFGSRGNAGEACETRPSLANQTSGSSRILLRGQDFVVHQPACSDSVDERCNEAQSRPSERRTRTRGSEEGCHGDGGVPGNERPLKSSGESVSLITHRPPVPPRTPPLDTQVYLISSSSDSAPSQPDLVQPLSEPSKEHGGLSDDKDEDNDDNDDDVDLSFDSIRDIFTMSTSGIVSPTRSSTIVSPTPSSTIIPSSCIDEVEEWNLEDSEPKVEEVQLPNLRKFLRPNVRLHHCTKTVEQDGIVHEIYQ